MSGEPAARGCSKAGGWPRGHPSRMSTEAAEAEEVVGGSGAQ
jgi:hypothetical protein